MHEQARYQSHGQHNYSSTRPRGSPGRVTRPDLQQSTVVLHRFRLKITSDYAQPDQKHMLKRRAARTQKTVDKSFAREIVKT